MKTLYRHLNIPRPFPKERPVFLWLIIACLLVMADCGRGPGHASPAGSSASVTSSSTFENPLLPSGPDPWVLQKDTTYYYTHTMGDHIAIYRTPKLSGLSDARPVTIWTPPATGPYSREIWAPELHYLQGKWYVYFGADDGNNDNHRIYALENDSPDPLSGSWVFKGKVADTLADKWAIDPSVFEYHNQLYLVWSGWPGNINEEQDIYIATLKDPINLDGRRMMISSPTHDWEKQGSVPGSLPSINEGPEAIFNPRGQLFLVFSASGCWTDNYCLGLLTLRENGDPMNPADWTKSIDPVFKSADDAVSPGHNAFFKSRDGKEDWILYHANPRTGQGCGKFRSPRMQPFTWRRDGSPDFSQPVPIHTPISKPSGE